MKQYFKYDITHDKDQETQYFIEAKTTMTSGVDVLDPIEQYFVQPPEEYNRKKINTRIIVKRYAIK